MNRVEVFKTNVQEMTQAEDLLSLLAQHFPDSRINFDLEDCDKVLRIEGYDIAIHKVILLVKEVGFECCELE